MARIGATISGIERTLLNRLADANAAIGLSSLRLATQASLLYTGAGGKTTGEASFTLTGELGSVSISVVNNEDLDDVAERINQNSHKTGVVASVEGDEVTFRSVDYGSRATVGIAATSGTFDVTGGTDGVDTGTDAVVEINGRTYDDQRVDGNRVTVNENGLTLQMEFVPGFTGEFAPFTISGSALTFATDPNLNNRTTLAIPGLQANQLGGISGTLDQIYSGGAYAGLDANTSRAIRIVDEAIGELDRVAASVDGFYSATLTTSSQYLADLQDELATAIEQTDGFSEEEQEAILARSQELAYNSISSLTILYQQHMGIITMIQHIAGLK